jgi:hypothetical protein
MRSTDNLDDENCQNPDEAPDPLSLSKQAVELHYFEQELPISGIPKEMGPTPYNTEEQLKGNRQNNAYKYNAYFGSMRNLCFMSVDKLMEREATLRHENEEQLKASSLKYNFAKVFNLNYVSLTDEPLRKIKDKCDGEVDSCLVNTNEGQIPAGSLNELINGGLSLALYSNNSQLGFFSKRGQFATKSSWEPNEYRQLFYKRGADNRVALCNMVANGIVRSLKAKHLINFMGFVHEGEIRKQALNECVRDGGLIHDIKYRVEQTGDYLFLGGLNLNINVAESFSMGWNNSWSSGFEVSDVIGMVATFGSKLFGFVAKPFSAKYSTSMSNSTGTNIAESTYLVSQVAGFQLDLMSYEKCAIARLSDQAVRDLRGYWEGWGIMKKVGAEAFDFDDSPTLSAFRTGYFVCEGSTKKENPTERIEETYFYFTQHFTEGDMLDQAELYNHPWLLAMRGWRDFAVFIDKIRAQEVADKWNFASGLLGFEEQRKRGWALEHLRDVYAGVFPSFPGYYTKLDPHEDITAFLLEQSRKSFTKTDEDPLGEVTHRTLTNDDSGQVGGFLGGDALGSLGRAQ